MPLKVIIIGAGLGGLATAIALTRAGHDVEVFEKSAFHNEVGAAIHLAPNATRILQQWDCDLQAMRPAFCDHLSAWDHKGNFVVTPAVTEKLQEQLGISDPWALVHRVDLHNALREQAEKGFAGKKPRIHLSCAVKSVEPVIGKVFLENGRVLQADLVIGADGVHSRTVEAVTGRPPKKKSTGQNCFRFLVPAEKLQANPITKDWINRIGYRSLNAFTDSDNPFRRLILYPCREGKIINALVFYPTDEEAVESSWLNKGNINDMVSEVEGFATELREFCSMAEDVKHWSLASRDPPPTFYRGKLALIGDAAHPTLPHQGQGGAQAFEDAAVLGALFTANTKQSQIELKLKLYTEVRYKRAVTVLFMSRVGSEIREAAMADLKAFVPDAKMPENMWLFTWNSFPAREAERALNWYESLKQVDGTISSNL